MTEKWTHILVPKAYREKLNQFRDKHGFDSQWEAGEKAIEIAEEQLTK